jgi:hypothetical protein
MMHSQTVDPAIPLEALRRALPREQHRLAVEVEAAMQLDHPETIDWLLDAIARHLPGDRRRVRALLDHCYDEMQCTGVGGGHRLH